MRKIYPVPVTIWKLKITCVECKAFTEFVLTHGRRDAIKNRAEAEAAVPWECFNGWYLGKEGREMCPGCYIKSKEFRRIEGLHR